MYVPYACWILYQLHDIIPIVSPYLHNDSYVLLMFDIFNVLEKIKLYKAPVGLHFCQICISDRSDVMLTSPINIEAVSGGSVTASNRQQIITWTNDDLVHWCICVSPGPNVLLGNGATPSSCIPMQDTQAKRIFVHDRPLIKSIPNVLDTAFHMLVWQWASEVVSASAIFPMFNYGVGDMELK